MPMNHCRHIAVLAIALAAINARGDAVKEKPMLKTQDIRVRDPYIVPVPAEQAYYLFGTTTLQSEGYNTDPRFDYYRSTDLEQWEGPFPAFQPAADFWSKTEYWAPEVHAYRGKFYMFATFHSPERRRGTQILVADQVAGPYVPLTDGPVTPEDWECLDGTLYVDPEGKPWMVFCHEWVQIGDGSICAVRLTEDLKEAVGEPVTLFHASEPAWVKALDIAGRDKPVYVTDGPFMHRLTNGRLLMLWASFDEKGYVEAIARSDSGSILGPWSHLDRPLLSGDGGHGMLFESLDGRLMFTFHRPNTTPLERAAFAEVLVKEDTLELKP